MGAILTRTILEFDCFQIQHSGSGPAFSPAEVVQDKRPFDFVVIRGLSAVSAPELATAYLPPSPHTQKMPPATTEQDFRANLSQFRWARGNNDDSQQTDQPANPFSRFYNAIGGGYIPLRSTERTNEDEAYFALSRWERYVTELISIHKPSYSWW